MTNIKTRHLSKISKSALISILKIVLFLILAPVFLIILIIAGIFIWEPYIIQINGCLDNGGRWDYEINECELPAPGTISYPYACTTAGGVWDYDFGKCVLDSEE